MSVTFTVQGGTVPAWWSAVHHVSNLGGGSSPEAVPSGQGGRNTGLQCTQVEEF